MEGGLMRFFGRGTASRLVEDEHDKRERLVRYYARNIHNKSVFFFFRVIKYFGHLCIGRFNIYFFAFIFCECLNLAMVILQFGMTNQFLSKRFLTYGFQVWRYYLLPDEEQQMSFQKNPMCETFPRIASCNYWKWGGAGVQENVSAICILGLNIVNDKVFLVLWWWFLLLILIAVLRLLYRVIQCRSSRLRYHLIKMRLHYNSKKSAKIKAIEAFVKKAELGDWFVLYQLSKNLNPPFFLEILSEISLKFSLEEAEDSDDESGLAGENIMSMLLKPSYTAQESEKGCNSPEVSLAVTPAEDDSTSPGHESSGRQFRKHKQEIRKIRKELVEIRHSEVPRGSEFECRVMDMKHSLRRKEREGRRASLRVEGGSRRESQGHSWGEGLDLLSVYSNFT